MLGVDLIGHGINATFAATLHTATGAVFCKGACDDGGMLRREVRVNSHLPPCAPRVRWALEIGDWSFAAFDHVSGRPADFAPGSPDLVALRVLFSEPWPAPPALVRHLSVRWAGLPGWARTLGQYRDSLDDWALARADRLLELERSAPSMVHGDWLLHTDMSPLNFLIGERVWLVDWAWACRGPAWVDIAFLVLRLIHAGHSCGEAEGWASAVSAWGTASDEALLAFVVAISGIWEFKSRTDPAPHRQALTQAARRWLAYRFPRSG